ncbi:hypothetical protein [Flavobacterium aestivum]|uniref:hypothetical protein n=1 Tax=Flavobacterium aestivum TaxID=3003257 RepID=UPI0022857BCA|nr:hypothetical protein [Flavobacterium aestivum]
MKTEQITTKESVYLIYAYVSIASFVLMVVSKITENLGKALDFNPIVSIIIVLNMVAFISLYYYKKKHNHK